jgi:hypothetical protein
MSYSPFWVPDEPTFLVWVIQAVNKKLFPEKRGRLRVSRYDILCRRCVFLILIELLVIKSSKRMNQLVEKSFKTIIVHCGDVCWEKKVALGSSPVILNAPVWMNDQVRCKRPSSNGHPSK